MRAALQITPEILAFIKTGRFIPQGPIFKKLKVKVGEGRFPPLFLSPSSFFPQGVKMAWTPKPTEIKNQKTEVLKSYSILIPHRKGEGARGKGGPWGGGRCPQPDGTTPPLNSCPKWDKPGAQHLKTPHIPFYQNQREKTFPPPQT